MKKNLQKLLVTALTVFVAVGASSVTFAQNTQDEVNKQIAKLIGDAISSRVSARALDASAPGQKSSGTELNALWGTYTRLNIDFTGGDVRTNVFVGGYDRDVTQNFIAGASVNYADSSGTFFVPPTVFTFDSHSKGISPYLSYMFTKNIFGTLKADYSESSGGGTRTESYGIGAELGGVYRTGDLVAKGRLGIGTSRSDSGGIGGKQSTTNYSGDGELGYYFTPTVYGLVGLQLSESDSPNSYQASARVGISANVSRTATLSATYERKVDDNAPAGVDFKVNSFTVGLRVRF